ncbi:MAG TPA: TonB-dependent receptor [Thermoanaerobaculia bacterium]|nr:TonB-dependent receptor [Thermoanaerobaculia bacterium]
MHRGIRMFRPAASLALPLVLFLAAGVAAAQPPAPPEQPAQPRPRGALAGRVVDDAGRPVAGARVSILELNRHATTGADGAFRFDNLPPGEYLLEAGSERVGTGLARAAVAAGEVAEITIGLDLAVHREEIVVTAGADGRGQTEIAQPTSVLSDEELARRLEPTLGETLNDEPGVTSTYFGPGASRPVIRGLGGDRVRVLQGGLGAGDASSTSPDHAVSIDPLAAERIEVLRGPATLLYGGSAVGGVVNVIDQRVPDRVPETPVTGVVELRGGTAAEERSGATSLLGGSGRLAWHLDFAKRESEDVEIPGFAESAAFRRQEEEEGEEHDQVAGVLENSAAESESGSVGVSWVTDEGFLGVALGGLETLYGVPGHAHEHGEEEGEEHGAEGPAEAPVRVDLEQRRADLRGAVTRPFGPFRAANLKLGASEYEHRELEGGEIGTLFTNESWEGRLELVQAPFGPVAGSLGVQAGKRDFAAVGEEAFTPPSTTDSWAVFAFEEVTRGAVTGQLGVRFERQDARAEGAGDRSHDGLSGSLGLVWVPGDSLSVGLSVARSAKLPTAEELFSNGPHIATRAFEIGDTGLEEETSLGVDLSLRKRDGPLRGELNLFVNRFDDFIFPQATGDEEDGLTVFRYVQRDAEFRGAELSGVVELFHGEPRHVDLELGADFVRAELRDTGEPLPRIPPRRYRLGLHYYGEHLQGMIEGQRVEEQDRVAPFELPTGAYTLVNASVSYRFFLGETFLDVLLRGKNLTDQEARNHVSFLKDQVPLPGRDFGVAVRFAF